MQITVPDDQDVDVCFFKILVTMEAIDIRPIEQPGFALSDAISQPWGARQSLPTEVFGIEWASEIITVISKCA